MFRKSKTEIETVIPTQNKVVNMPRIEFETTNIKGKEYVEVNTRVQFFRENKAYQGWSLLTEIVELTDKKAVMRAVIRDDQNRMIASGIAYELADSSYINKTSYIENCETSAWGRALGNLGIGISTSIASSEEVQNAAANQGQNKIEKITMKQVKDLEILIASGNINQEALADWIKREFKTDYRQLRKLNPKQYEEVVAAVNKKIKYNNQ